MKYSFLLVLIALSNYLISAEVTISDRIRYEGELYLIYNSPLEPYFELFPEIAPSAKCFQLSRCYEATYEIHNSKLYLVELNALVNKANEDWEIDILSEVFPNQEKVHMEWYSAPLIIDLYKLDRVYDEQLRYEYLKIEIQEGTVVGRKKMLTENGMKRIKKKLFKRFKKTEEFSTIRDQYSNWKISDLKREIGYAILDKTADIDLSKTFHGKN